MTFCYVNESVMESSRAVISAGDRGFRYGDGVFETILVHNGLPYLWEYHLERLDAGLSALHIRFDTSGLLVKAIRLCQANTIVTGLLRMQISRGVGGRGYLPADASPTLVMETFPLPDKPPQTMRLWLSSYEKISPRALPTRFKLTQGLNSTLARMEADSHGCDEALQLGEGGVVSEAGSANVFWRVGATLYTPSLDCGVLAGVTRRRMMELSPSPVKEGRFTLEHVKQGNAFVLTNSTYGAVPVASLAPDMRFSESIGLAEEMNALRNKDIDQYIAASRESLARM